MCFIFDMATWHHVPAGKTQRLKQAKADADVEIKAYLESCERQYKAKEAQHDGAADDAVVRITADKNQKILALDAYVKDNKEEVSILRQECVHSTVGRSSKSCWISQCRLSRACTRTTTASRRSNIVCRVDVMDGNVKRRVYNFPEFASPRAAVMSHRAKMPV